MSVAVERSSDVFEHKSSNNPDPVSSSDSSDDHESEGGWSDDDWVSTESERSSDEEAQSLSTISSHDSSSNNEKQSTEVQFPQNLDFRNDWNMNDVHEQGAVVGASPLQRKSYHERNGGKGHSIVDLIGVPDRKTVSVTGLGNDLDAMAFIDRRIGQNHKKEASKRFNFNHGGGDNNAAMQEQPPQRPSRIPKQDESFEKDSSASNTAASNQSSGMDDSWKAELSMLKNPLEGSEKINLEGSMKMNDIKLASKKANEDEEWGELSELSDTSFNVVSLDDKSNYNQETGFFDWHKARHRKKGGKAGHRKKQTNGVPPQSEEVFYDWAKERRKKAKSSKMNHSGHSRQSGASSSHEEAAQNNDDNVNEQPDDVTVKSYFDWETKQRKTSQQNHNHHEKKKHGKKKGT